MSSVVLRTAPSGEGRDPEPQGLKVRLGRRRALARRIASGPAFAGMTVKGSERGALAECGGPLLASAEMFEKFDRPNGLRLERPPSSRLEVPSLVTLP